MVDGPEDAVQALVGVVAGAALPATPSDARAALPTVSAWRRDFDAWIAALKAAQSFGARTSGLAGDRAGPAAATSVLPHQLLMGED